MSTDTDDLPATFGPRFDVALYAALAALLVLDAVRVVGAADAPATVDIVAIAVAAIALLACGTIAARRGRANGAVAFAIGASIGFLFFARTLGLALVDPSAIAWLLMQDLGQHYSGWAMFRHTPWHWPPGAMPEVWYPVGTSIVYTDSLPLLALALKPFSAWLPEPFQYIGLWLLASFTLQGAFGALLVARATVRPAAVLAGAALFVFAPILVNRIDHDTLTAQWILLASLWLYFRTPVQRTFAAQARPWWLLSAVAALVHPYLAAMSLAIQFAAAWRNVRIDRSVRLRDASLAFGVSIAITVVLWALCGTISIRMTDSGGGVAFGQYSMNLLSFVDPLYGSLLLPKIGALPGQFEGSAYLGAGVLALLAIAIVDLVRDRALTGVDRTWRPLALVALTLLVFATGGVIAFGAHQWLDLGVESRVLDTFRSSGRFVWIAVYVLMLLEIVHVARRYPAAVASALLSAALVVQVVDLAPNHARVAQRRHAAHAGRPGTRLADPRWESLASGRHHLTLLPPPACGQAAAPYLPMLLFAAEHAMTLNSGQLARWNRGRTAAYCADLSRQLSTGSWSADDIYVVGPAWRERFERSAPHARCESLDGYRACITDAAPHKR
jgi:hypothetical protein